MNSLDGASPVDLNRTTVLPAATTQSLVAVLPSRFEHALMADIHDALAGRATHYIESGLTKLRDFSPAEKKAWLESDGGKKWIAYLEAVPRIGE